MIPINNIPTYRDRKQKGKKPSFQPLTYLMLAFCCIKLSSVFLFVHPTRAFVSNSDSIVYIKLDFAFFHLKFQLLKKLIS